MNIAGLFPDVSPVSNEPGRFRVTSRSGRGSRLVDLFMWSFNGACDCEDFEMRHAPKLRRGAAPAAALRCHHIRRARELFLDLALRGVARGAQPERAA
jgi:hypothetical protein